MRRYNSTQSNLTDANHLNIYLFNASNEKRPY